MLREEGRVVAAQGNTVWVETVRRSTCGKCSARAGCGQGLWSKMSSTQSNRNLIRLQSDNPVSVGDTLIMGIPENTLLRSSFLSYGMPILMLILFVALADGVFGMPEGAVILSAGAGLAVGFLILKLHGFLTGGHKQFQPVVLEVASIDSRTPSIHP